jgi:IS5 family transposase
MIGVPAGDKGEDSSRSRQALAARDIEPRIPLHRGRKIPVPHHHAP